MPPLLFVFPFRMLAAFRDDWDPPERSGAGEDICRGMGYLFRGRENSFLGRLSMECLVGETSVHCDVRGRGRPILMIHGFGPDHRLMLGCMEPVFQKYTGWKRI